MFALSPKSIENVDNFRPVSITNDSDEWRPIPLRSMMTKTKRRSSLDVQRMRVIEEIKSSERSYLSFLRKTSDYFEMPLRLNHMVPSGVHTAIFSNLQAILRLNEELYNHLSHMEIGQAFLEMAPFLKLYSHYARHHFQALTVYQEWLSKSLEFVEFIAAQEQRPEVGLKLNALLIMPVQRVPRYEMLLRELLRLSPPDLFGEEYISLSRALEAIMDVACHINNHVRLAEHAQHMNRIQSRLAGRNIPHLIAPGRTFIKEGRLKKVSKRHGSAHDRIFFLFSDILMYAKPVGSAQNVGDGSVPNSTCKIQCCSILPLHHCRIERLFGLTQDANALMFKVSCKRTTLILFSPQRENGEEWIGIVESAIKKVQSDRLTLRKESSAKEPMRASQFNRVSAMKRKAHDNSPNVTNASLLSDSTRCFSPKRTRIDDTSSPDISNRTAADILPEQQQRAKCCFL